MYCSYTQFKFIKGIKLARYMLWVNTYAFIPNSSQNLFKLTIVISSNRVNNRTTTFWPAAEARLKIQNLLNTHLRQELKTAKSNQHHVGYERLTCHLEYNFIPKTIASYFAKFIFSFFSLGACWCHLVFKSEKFESQRGTQGEKTLLINTPCIYYCKKKAKRIAHETSNAIRLRCNPFILKE